MPRLVLTRKPGEAITVDGPATITLRKAGPRTRLVIDAPETTKVLRMEVKDRPGSSPVETDR